MSINYDPDQIRAALDLTLTSANLPNNVINMDIYARAGIAEILAQYPTADSATGDDGLRINNAVNFIIAARLAPAIPALVREEHGTSKYERKAVDWNARAAELRSYAEAELGMLENIPAAQTSDLTDMMPAMFGLASGRRGF